MWQRPLWSSQTVSHKQQDQQLQRLGAVCQQRGSENCGGVEKITGGRDGVCSRERNLDAGVTEPLEVQPMF